MVDSLDSQKVIASGKRFDEPEELMDYFCNLDNLISASADEIKDLKNTFEQVAELLQYILQSSNLQLIPVGSFVIGCIRKDQLCIDSYLHLDVSNNNVTSEEIVSLFDMKKNSQDCPSPLFFNFSITAERDPLNQEEYLLLKNNNNLNTIRVFLMKLNNQTGTKLVSHYTAGIYHSNWLVQNLSSAQNNPNVIRLLRLIRSWKLVKGFNSLPTEILDLTLSYATFSFKETGVFKVLLKFFTLLTLMLCRQNENFYELSEYHSFLISQMTSDQKDKVIEAAQTSFANLSINDTSDFKKNSSSSTI